MFSHEQRAAFCSMIVERIAQGEFVEDICATDGFPSWQTVYRWQADDVEFERQCARARSLSAPLIERKLAKLADDTIAGTIDPKAANAASNILTWIAKVRDRSRYGDKVELDGKLRVVPELELTLNGPAPKVIDVEPEDDDSN